MNRAEFRTAALVRLVDADTLLKARRWDGAYYLCGYVIECALKACIARQFKRSDIPDPDDVRRIWTHNLAALLKLAGLESALQQDMRNDPALTISWNNVRAWEPESRYAYRRTKQEAMDLYDGVADPVSGVLQWIKQYW